MVRRSCPVLDRCDEFGIPLDAVKNTETHVWLLDKKFGRVYKRSHGKRATYCAGCRCTRCSKASATASKASKYRTRGGSGQHDGDVIRAHISMLMEEKGLSLGVISKLTGIHRSSLLRIVKGDTQAVGAPRRPPPLKVTKGNGDRILAVTSAQDAEKETGWFVPPELSVKRVQSLVAAGFPVKWMGRQLRPGLTRNLSHLAQEGVERKYIDIRTAREVQTLYRMLGNRLADPVRDGIRQSAITLARRRASESGWGVPATWDDPGTLWGKAEEPGECESVGVDWVMVERLAAGEYPDGHSKAERVEAVKLLLHRGVGYNQMLLALHMSSQSYLKICKEEGLPHPAIESEDDE